MDSARIKSFSMKIFFSQIWKYLTVFFAGVITAMVYSIRQFHDHTIINAETYIASQEQKIGKLKQRGEGNSQEAFIPSINPDRKKKRIDRRTARRESRRKVESENTLPEELETDDR